MSTKNAYMRLRASFLVIILLAVSAISCRKTVSSGPDTIPYVKSILNDRAGSDFKILSSSAAVGSKGTIAIVDNPARSSKLRDEFVGCDFFENIDGKLDPDLLPDFAGETIVALIDSSFDAKMQSVDSEGIRELAVKSFVSALDTVVRAKAVVLSSPLMATDAVFDIDSLKHFFGLDIPVIYPIRTASEYVKSKYGSDASIMVISGSDSIWKPGQYDRLFSYPYVVHTMEGADSLSFRNILMEYAAGDGAKALNAVVVDDYMTDTGSFLLEIDEIINVESPENLALRQLISVGFEVVDCREMAAKTCYKEFRNHNIFTHNVAYPIGLTLNVQD